MTSADFVAILPLLALTGAAVAVMLGVAVRRSHRASYLIALAGLVAAFGSLRAAASVAPRQVTALLAVDSYALFFTGLIIAGTFATAVMARPYLEMHATQREEFYILLPTAALGAAVLASSSHFVSFFLGLELLSVPLYAMIAYLYSSERSVEAGLKYLVLAAASAAFLLFGIALLYAETGTMEFAQLARRLPGAGALAIPATALIVAGIGFKLAVVPFHMWTPDVYEGAPAPVAAFIATVSKGAVAALLMRYFYGTGAGQARAIWLAVALAAAASMIAGNLLALLQTNVKRLLAYSSIAHMGYILVAFLAAGPDGASAVTFYLVAYFVTILAAFGVVAALSTGERDADDIADYRGLFRRRPVLASVMAAMLFSLAGIPLTAGFTAKFYVAAAGASSALWALLLTLAITSGMGVYYYLRVVVAIYGGEEGAAPLPATSAASGLLLGALTVALVWLGVYPGPMLDLIRATVRF
jgi:NADH-quinone oxidoreductase subunit N